MKPFHTLSIAAGLLGLASVSHAGLIASPTIYGAFHQDTAECVVRNVGKTNLTVDVRILDESGNSLPTGGNCGAAIAPGDHCFRRALIASGVAYACSASFSGSSKNLRANLVLIDDIGSTETPLRSAALR